MTLLQHGEVFRRGKRKRCPQLPQILALCPLHRALQGRVKTLAVGYKMSQGRVAKGLFQYAVIGIIGRRVSRLFKRLHGRRIFAPHKRQPSQFQKRNACQGMIEFARHKHRALQAGHALVFLARRHRRQSPLHVGPCLGPVIGRRYLAAQCARHPFRQWIVFAYRAQYFRAAAYGQRSAADDLLRLDGIKNGLLYYAALL